MTPDAFATAVRTLCQTYGGSVTSWGRTIAHNAAVGGVKGSAHTWWVGADVVWDSIPTPSMAQEAFTAGLRVIHERDHDHFQPLDWHNVEAP